MRILCLTGCALGLSFVLALLAPRSETAYAESAPAEGATASDDDATSSTLDLSVDGTDAVSVAESTVATDPTLWADPSALSATATRRANGDVAWSAPRRAAPERPSAPAGPTPGMRAPEGLATITTPIGSSGAGVGAPPDAGPSIAQLAVLSAALVGVRWLSQRLRANELPWRSALITLSIERPG
jgi:hypothetical protein